MFKLVRVLVALAALFSGAFMVRAQNKHPPEQAKRQPEEHFFAGNVVGLTSDTLTVSRRTVTLTTVTKIFLRDANTVIEGKLKLRSRVTVKFEKADNAERAQRIVVR